jgi:anti-sigma B factor antagonist
VTALSFDITHDGPSRITIAVSGEVDMETAPQLRDCLIAHADKDITVDLEGVGFLDSSGLSALIHGYKRLRAAQRTLRTTGESDTILTVMDIAGVTEIFHGTSVEP